MVETLPEPHADIPLTDNLKKLQELISKKKATEDLIRSGHVHEVEAEPEEKRFKRLMNDSSAWDKLS